MKKLLILISLLTGIVFAGECEHLYREFVKRVPGQDVTICRVNVEGRTDVVGMYFKMNKQLTVLLYGTNYDTMLYAGNDPYVANAHCIKNGQYRILTRYMTGSQIAEKLLSFKNCEDEFTIKHDPKRNDHWVMTN